MMDGSGDPRGVHFISDHNPINFTHGPSPNSSQLSITSGPPTMDRNAIYVVQPPQSIASASNSTTDFSNSHVLTIDSTRRRAIGDPANCSASLAPGNALPVESFSPVKPVQRPPQPTLYNPTGMNLGASFASQNSFMTPQLSQPNSLQMSTQAQMMPQHFVTQLQPQPQSPLAFLSPDGSGAVSAAGQTVMLVPTIPNATSSGSFYSLQPSSTQMAAAMHLSSPNPQLGSVPPAHLTFVMNSVTPSVAPFSGYAERHLTLSGPAAWQSAVPPALPPPQSYFFTAAYAPPVVSTPPASTAASTAATAVRRPPMSSAATGRPAASGSPGGAQPAALGVRSFMAPNPIGSCMVRDAPLIPTIPPLALPAPAWGKLPNTAVARPKESTSA